MLIDNIATNPGPDIYYNQNFRVVLEDHMTFLRNHSETTTASVTPSQAFKYEGDLAWLLYELNIPAHLHWVVMRINKLNSPVDLGKDCNYLFIPNPSVIERIRSTYSTQNKIKT
jgi:hypothetical protein